jgi:acetoin utilization deacetylase AcuC-like enzyme
MIAIYFSKEFYLHTPPMGLYHPENPRRLEIALNALHYSGFKENIIEVQNVEVDVNAQEFLLKMHDSAYVEHIFKLCSQGFEGYIDNDTYVSRGTCKAAQKAIEISMMATKHVLEHRHSLALALVRPPGHHAGVMGKAMGASTQGFCIFNNIAAATTYALHSGFKRILIIDIDVHHGNGTQQIFWNNPDVIHIDVHEHGIYPGTGDIHDIGGKGAEGTKVNIPLPPYSGDEDYIYIFSTLVEPLIYAVKPRLIAVSAGFDAYSNDGLAEMRLTEGFYEFFGRMLYEVSRALGIGVVATLEGGYSIGLRNGLPAMLKGFAKQEYAKFRIEEIKTSYAIKTLVNEVMQILKQYIAI